MNSATVRVRGIYATALTKILLDEGLRIVQASRVISERFGLNEDNEPARVTVKSLDEDPEVIMVIGDARFFGNVYETLTSRLKHSFRRRSFLQQYSTVVVKIVGSRNGLCVGDAGGHEVLFEAKECREGELRTVCITKASVGRGFSMGIEGVCVLKDTLVLYDKPRYSVSRYIKSSERRRELEALSVKLAREGFGVRWRSNAGVATLDYISSELEDARSRVKKLLLATGSPGEVLSEGEYIGFITPSILDKQYLDYVRSKVIPTITFHHTLKICREPLSSIVEYCEHLVKSGLDEHFIGLQTLSYAWSLVGGSKRTYILQRHPEGEAYRIGPFKTCGFENEVLVLERTIKSQGYYDGLNAKREPGDKAYTLIKPGSWIIMHIYKNPEGLVKGVYVNINTPPEPCPDYLRVLDLHVDVTLDSSGARIIDEDLLNKSLEMGFLSRELHDKAVRAARASLEYLSLEPLDSFNNLRDSIDKYLELDHKVNTALGWLGFE